MFPYIERDLIILVLEQNDNKVQLSIDHLLVISANMYDQKIDNKSDNIVSIVQNAEQGKIEKQITSNKTITNNTSINNTNLNINVSYQFGKIGNSRLDFQGANSPDPTYYRNLPSFFTSAYETDPAIVNQTDPSVYQPGGLGGISEYDPNVPTNPALLGAQSANFITRKQIDWNGLYQANAVANTFGEGAKYILYEDRTDDRQWTANTVLSSQLADNISLNAGTTFTKIKSHNFKNLLDLLGANFFNDVTLFGAGDQRQPDLNNPNRIVGKGDTFGYNYNLFTTKLDAFTQFK